MDNINAMVNTAHGNKTVFMTEQPPQTDDVQSLCNKPCQNELQRNVGNQQIFFYYYSSFQVCGPTEKVCLAANKKVTTGSQKSACQLSVLVGFLCVDIADHFTQKSGLPSF